jgi:peptidyl-prolyl cis-trans isomerase B (cyclophilin B)
MGKLNHALRAAATVVTGALCSTSNAQLAPERTYFGTNRPLPIVVTSPGTENPLSIKLIDSADAVLETKEAVEPGKVDLAALFPSLWESEGNRGVLYAQLFDGDAAVGPAVVIQPLVSPSYAARTSQRTGKPEWTPSPRIFSGYRAYVEQDVLMSTTEGDILFRMRPDEAPNTVWNFMSLGEGGFYTDIAFHRIIAEFVIQAGDPRGEGSGGPGYYLDLEDSKLPHDFGVLSMARSADPNSNGSQVFVCLSRERTKGLDSRYTGFGQAISGADVITKIADTPLQAAPNNESPVNPPLIQSVTLIDAAPRGTGAAPVTMPADESPSSGR